MKFFTLMRLMLATFGVAVIADNITTTPPICGLNCIEQETLKSTCSIANVTCICTNAELNEQIAMCVQLNCTLRESLALEKFSKDSCGVPPRDRTALVQIIAVVFLGLGLLSFGLRVIARLCLRNQKWGSDDWVLLVAVGMMVPLNALSVPISHVALGKDIWNVSPDDITEFLYIFFWDELLYLGSLPLTKISILLFYLRIFPHKMTRYACWVLIGINVAYFIVFELISIFQCTPIEGAWKAWDREFPATCRNINMQGWMAAALNIILDLATMILPLPEIYKLSLSWRKRIQIMMMFSIGFFVTIVSVLRLRSLASYATTSNVTQDYVEIGYWSTIEVPVGILCTSLPAIRSLFSRAFPKAFGTTQGSKSSYADISRQSHPTARSEKSAPVISNPQAIGVKKEFSITSRHQDDSSTFELTNMSFSERGTSQASYKYPTMPLEPV